MDLAKCIKATNLKTNLNEYISFTRDIEKKFNNLKILFNASTVLSLKDIASIEIEYFNKCEEIGAATKIFEVLLRSPPSKKWSLLGKDMICILQYWLEAIRKHLILSNVHWWTLLKLLLQFIKEINTKDQSISKTLVEDTADALLDLSTHRIPEPEQKYEIIKCFNTFSLDSSRNIRFAYKDRFQKYFVKLAAVLSKCGDFLLQYSILETLLRWLVPRHDPDVRRAASNSWFTQDLYKENAVKIFLERRWVNFVKDARDFLNAQNENSDLVTSALCDELIVGKTVCTSDKYEKMYWLDVNSSTKCITILLASKIFENLRAQNDDSDAIMITETNTRKLEMSLASHQHVVIKISVHDLSYVYPFRKDIMNGSRDIFIRVGSMNNIPRLGSALAAVFAGKYQVSFDVHNFIPTGPETTHLSVDVINDTEDDTRFSIPVEVRRQRHAGYVQKKNPASIRSPSMVSTSSLVQLHEKISTLPRYEYNKTLSTITEVSELNENQRSSSLSTVKIGSLRLDNSKDINDSNKPVSCLVLAEEEPNNISVNPSTHLPKDIHDINIVDLLDHQVQINISKHNRDLDFDHNNKLQNEQEINNLQGGFDGVDTDKPIDVQALEDFFTQHISENRNRDLVISPTLARKINETSSECSEDIDNCLLSCMNIAQDIEIDAFEPDIDVVECINSIVDKVCEDFDKCTRYLGLEVENINMDDSTVKPDKKSQPSSKKKTTLVVGKRQNTARKSTTPKLVVKINKQPNSKVQPFTVMSPIIEKVSTAGDSTAKDESPTNTPLIRRRRKLYSPKDEMCNDISVHDNASSDINSNIDPELNKYTKTPKGSATCYKVLENERLNRIRKSRPRRSSSNRNSNLIHSPRTLKKNQVFDSLKDVIDGESVNLVNKKSLHHNLSVYNMSSDSDDEHTKKTTPASKAPNTTINSPKGRRTRSRTTKTQVDKLKNVDVGTKANKRGIKKPIKKRLPKRGKENVSDIAEPSSNLIDERMRTDSAEILNVSIANENTEIEDHTIKEPELVLKDIPQMECITENCVELERSEKSDQNIEFGTKIKTSICLSLKRLKKSKNNLDKSIADNDKTSSPLPGLVVETTQKAPEAPNDSINNNMMEILKDIYQGKPNDVPLENIANNSLVSEPVQDSLVKVNAAEEHNEEARKISKVTVAAKSTNAKSKKANVNLRNKEIRRVKKERFKRDEIVKKDNVCKTAQPANDADSEKTIPTLCNSSSPITGHRNSNEDPPSSTLLIKEIQPRGLEQECYSESLKDLYKTLNGELNENSIVQDETDYAKRFSECRYKRKSGSNDKSVNGNVPAATISLQALNTGMQFDLSDRDGSVKSDGNRLSSKDSIAIDIQPRVVLTRQPLHKLLSSCSEASADLTKAASDKRIKGKKEKSKGIQNDKSKITKETSVTKRKHSTTTEKARRSPILQNVISSSDENSDSDRELLNRIRRRFPYRKKGVIRSNSDGGKTNKAADTGPVVSNVNQGYVPEDSISSGSSGKKEASKDSRIVSKRRSSPLHKPAKRAKIAEKETANENDQTSSVYEWFKRNAAAATSTRSSTPVNTLAADQYISTVLEMLDTTLPEIHHNTSKRIVNMFVNVHKNLDKLMDKQEQLYKETAKDILSSVIGIIDTKFAELNNRTQEMSKQFVKGLRVQAKELIREECNYKRMMVTMLREDVKAVQDNLNKGN